MLKRVVYFLLTIFLVSASASADTIIQNGDCNVASGSYNNPTCGNSKPKKPDRNYLLKQIKESNEINIYNIDGIKYINGYRGSLDEQYVVVADIYVTTVASCEEIGQLYKSVPLGPGKESNLPEFFALSGIALNFSIKFGGNCSAGDRFIIRYIDTFRYTEDGWVLEDQEDGGVQKR